MRPVSVRRSVASVSTRRRRVREALAASGVAPVDTLPTLDMARLSAAQRFFWAEALGAGISNFAGEEWPTEETELDATAAVFRDGNSAVFVADGTLTLVSLYRGWVVVNVAATEQEKIQATMAAFRAAIPPAYLVVGEDSRVPITFWACGHLGPTSRLRRVEAASWESIERNYPGDVRAELNDLMSWTGRERDGQLMLWQGPPGCGKTWALRALASEWAPWAEFHYITDPDVFFVERPSYMIDVLLSDSYEAIDPTGDIVTEQGGDKWRVLILEDTGELLAANAKEKYGQGLSRLLNVVDGMIGQGLRVLALITTNDELGDLAPAAIRPGRCVSRSSDGVVGPTVFGPLSASEASVWLGSEVEEGGTLAELYARASGATDAFSEETGEEVVEVEVAAADDRSRDFAELLRLARAPLEEEEVVVEVATPTADPALEILAERAASSERVALAAVEALGRFAEQPAPPAPQLTTHMHLPDHALTLHHHDGDLTLEPHSHTTVEPAKVEPAIEVAAAPVDVHVAAAPIPDVHVHVPQSSSPKAIRVEYDDDGFRHYVPVEDGPEADPAA